MPKVLIAPATMIGIPGEFIRVLQEAGFELVYPKRVGLQTEEELLELLRGVKASLAGSETYSPRVLQAHPQLKVIARAGVGYDGVDMPTATRQGIAVTIAPNTNQEAVAEHTFALMLAVAKYVVAHDAGTRAGKWPRQPTIPLRGRTLGIAGLGRIGRSVAVRGAVFGMPVIAYEPYPDLGFVEQCRIRLVSFEELLAQADFLTLHLPLTEESRHLINRRTLSQMKPTAYLINTARGGLVNEADLLETLQQKKIAGAGLDVFEQEPAKASNPLFALSNVVVTPHTAGVDLQSRDDMGTSAAQAIADISRGHWPADKVVNPEVRDRFSWE
jgi:D-3-phosphoglycerate dehydrogenase